MERANTAVSKRPPNPNLEPIFPLKYIEYEAYGLGFSAKGIVPLK